jgi:hypothetical protein
VTDRLLGVLRCRAPLDVDGAVQIEAAIPSGQGRRGNPSSTLSTPTYIALNKPYHSLPTVYNIPHIPSIPFCTSQLCEEAMQESIDGQEK